MVLILILDSEDLNSLSVGISFIEFMSEFNEFKPRLKFPENLNRIQFKVEPTIFEPRLKFNKFGLILF